jgi:hypothetical protein
MDDFFVSHNNRAAIRAIVSTIKAVSEAYKVTIFAYVEKHSGDVYGSIREHPNWVARVEPDGSTFTQPGKLNG